MRKVHLTRLVAVVVAARAFSTETVDCAVALERLNYCHAVARLMRDNRNNESPTRSFVPFCALGIAIN